MKKPKILAAVSLLILLAIVHLGAIYLTGTFGWDDGAITLAYSKTLVEEGIFALTRQSEVVEGTSSLLMTFVMAALHRIFNFSFEGFISASQLFSLSALSLCLLLLYRYLKPAIEDRFRRVVIVALTGLLPMFIAENVNGMEMTMFAFLLAAAAAAYSHRPAWLTLLIPLLLLVRFECVFFLGFSFFIVFVVKKDERRTAIIWLGYTAVCFSVIALCRWMYFDDVLPNPIWAKMNPPYSSDRGLIPALSEKFGGLFEFTKVYLFLILGVLAAYITGKDTFKRLDFKVAVILSFAIFAFLTGADWGYAGRRALAVTPLFVMIVADAFRDRLSREGGFSLEAGTLKVRMHSAALAFWILVLALAGAHYTNSLQAYKNVEAASIGGFHSQKFPQPVLAYLSTKGVIMRQVTYDWYSVTPENYRITGVAVDGIRSSLGLESLTIMVPDVGGLGLCCSSLKVIDYGLLTNRNFARNGLSEFGAQLADSKPEVVEMHEGWSKLTKVFESDLLLSRYTPIVFENNLLWLRSDLLNRLLTSDKVGAERVSDFTSLRTVRYFNEDYERLLIAERKYEVIWKMGRRDR